jgi:hypothetical protein
MAIEMIKKIILIEEDIIIMLYQKNLKMLMKQEVSK